MAVSRPGVFSYTEHLWEGDRPHDLQSETLQAAGLLLLVRSLEIPNADQYPSDGGESDINDYPIWDRIFVDSGYFGTNFDG